jgi:hypothetical protein
MGSDGVLGRCDSSSDGKGAVGIDDGAASWPVGDAGER